MLSEVILKGIVYLIIVGAIGFIILFVIWLAKSIEEETLRSLLLTGLIFFAGILAALCVIMLVLTLRSPGGGPGQPPAAPLSGQPDRPAGPDGASSQWTLPTTR